MHDGTAYADEEIAVSVEGPRLGFADEHVIQDRRLSHGAVHLYVDMTAHLGPSGNGMIPSIEIMADEIGATVEDAREFARELTCAGYVTGKLDSNE